LDELQAAYKPSTVLKYAPAREFMFENLQVSEDTIEAIYSGYKLHIPKGVPSRAWTFDRGINTEHIYPRSKGASDGNAFSDLHALKPARAEINSARLNHPFKEIDDSETKKWFRDAEFTFDVPIDRIDEYSELDSFAFPDGYVTGEFEPRESAKGDIARAVFYFYTMYTAEALAADSDYFEEMKADLCEWHVMDPVDDNELKFTHLIATQQDEKPNPFILDCTLALRSYCANQNLSCNNQTVATVELASHAGISIFPNPASNVVNIQSPMKLSRVEVYNEIGSKVITSLDNYSQIDLSTLSEGVYHVLMHADNEKVYSTKVTVVR